MRVQTHTTRRPYRTSRSTEPTAERHRAAGRTIVASLVAGAVAALLLVLVVFTSGATSSGWPSQL